MRKPMRYICRCICLCTALALLSGLSGMRADAAGDAQARSDDDPVIYVPQAPGTAVIGQEPLQVDVSNASQGYVMARYSGPAQKAAIQLTGPDGITYKYFLPPSDAYVPLPLTSGSGDYAINGYENVSGTTYVTLFKDSISVSLDSELLPYLYPNQYVLFDQDSQVVSAAAEVTSGALTDLEVVAQIYHYVIDNVTYDTEKAATVPNGYLPSVDETLASGTGICFDYAALVTAMLRSQDIPTRLEIGYVGNIYHSWISVYMEDEGWIDKYIEFSSDGWTRMDPTFAASSGSSEAILRYIGDGTNYTLQYLH